MPNHLDPYLRVFIPAFEDPEPKDPEPKEPKDPEPKDPKDPKDPEPKDQQYKKVIDQLTTELDALKKRSNLSTKDRQDMERRIEDLNNQLLTKEELAAKEKNKLLKQLESERESLSQEAKSWRQRFEEKTIVGALTEAAAGANAYNPKQIVTMLRGETALSEVMDGDQPTGQFEVVVTLDTTNDKGENVKLTLKPQEAVKHLSEQDDYLNLFKTDDRNGFGGGPSRKSGQVDAATIAKDPKAYREMRRKGLI